MATQLVHGYEAYKPEIDAYIEQEQGRLENGDYTMIYNVQATDRLTINEKTISSYGPMEEVGETGDAVEDESLDGYKTQYTRRTYRKMTSFGSDLLETDQTNTIETLARNLPRTLEYSRNLFTFSTFRRAWDATKTYGDAKPLVSTAHPRKDGGTAQSNTFTSGVQKALTYDNAVELRDVVLSQLTNSGNILSIGNSGRKQVLWVNRYLEEEAFQIAGVEGLEYQPDTADHNGNFFRKGSKFDVYTLKFVSYEAARQAGETTVAKTASGNFYDTMWGIMDYDTCMEFWKMYVAEGYSNGKYDDEITKRNQVLNKYAYDKYVFGVTDWLGFAASKGDGTTYTG